jgi:hypothetical protein
MLLTSGEGAPNCCDVLYGCCSNLRKGTVVGKGKGILQYGVAYWGRHQAVVPSIKDFY